MKVLIVDDDLVSRLMLTKALEGLGHEVIPAADGCQALACFRNDPVGLLITDWQMPQMNGLELCRRVRELQEGSYTYLIVLTSREGKQDLLVVFDAGADDYMVKPFDPDELKARMKTAERILALESGHRRDNAVLVEKTQTIEALNRSLHEAHHQVQAQNAELEKALAQIKQSQAQIIQSEKLASIGQLAAGVAHEINNPTGFVSSNLKTLADYHEDLDRLIDGYRRLCGKVISSNPDGAALNDIAAVAREAVQVEKEVDVDFIRQDIRALVKECREGTERIKKIVMDLKDFAHPGEDTCKAADIHQCIESTLNVVHNELKYKAKVAKAFGRLPLVNCFPQQLNQVFMNILVNAAQAIETKGEIAIRTRCANGCVEIEFRDNGCGIAPENRSRIFDPFFTTKEVGKGTGLGMNIAYNIVKKHHGSIDVDSQVGKGTTFTIRLPMEAET